MLFVGILLAARSFPQGPLRVLLVRCSNNMLYPKEDKATKCLMQACRNCGHCSPSAGGADGPRSCGKVSCS